VDVWVLGRTRIRLRVRTWLLIFFHPRNAKDISVSFEPSSAKAVFLTNDTELSVAPKTRRQWNSEKHIVNGENPIMKSDPAMTSPTARTPSYTVLLRVLPTSMFLDHLPSLLDSGSVIFVSQRMLSVARLEGLLPSDPKTSLIADVKRLDPPTDPAGAANPSPSDAAPIAKVLNPSEATKREDVQEELSKAGHVRVVGMDGVLEGRMIIFGGVDGVEDWDVVRQVLGSGRRNVSQDS
jgi:peroxin-1